MVFAGKLTSSREADPKVTHNKAVAMYYKSAFTKTDDFKQTLEAVCGKVTFVVC